MPHKYCTVVKLSESEAHNNLKCPFMAACFDIYVTSMNKRDLTRQIGKESVVYFVPQCVVVNNHAASRK